MGTKNRNPLLETDIRKLLFTQISTVIYKTKAGMPNYIFKTQEFGVTNQGIHLLRSGFIYETIAFEQIKKIETKKGKELNSWIVILLIGLILLIPGIYVCSKIMDAILNGQMSARGAKMILLIFIPMIGAYFVYTALKTGPIVVINYGHNKRAKFPLQSIADDKQLDSFALLMRTKLKPKI